MSANATGADGSPSLYNTEPAFIYTTQNILTLISRAWNLVRANLKTSALVVLGPVLLMTVFHVLVSLLSSKTFLTPTSGTAMAFSVLVMLVSGLLLIPCYFYWMFSYCVLSRFYYSAIVAETPVGIRDCWRYLFRIWKPLTLLILLMVALAGFFAFLDFVVLGLGFVLSMFVTGALAAYTKFSQPLLPGIMMVFFLLLWGFVVLMATISLVSIQAACFVFPLVVASTNPDPVFSWRKTFERAYRLVFDNLQRIVLFSFCLFCFSSVLGLVLMGPAWLWVALEMARLGVSQQHQIPFHMQAVLNLWSSLAALLTVPFQVSAMTLFWYDCQVRQEGVDLRLWLQRIIRHQGKPPETYLPSIQPQPLPSA